MINDVTDHLAVSRLGIATGNIFRRGTLPDSITFGAIPAVVIHYGINWSWNCSDISRYGHKNHSFI
jgi:hypothetical protein